MAFSEEIKLNVKKKSMFRCCRCQSIGIDVHHIIPKKDNGPDTFDNAAPLCQNCHDQFGDNPIKRKEIRQMRDNWYERVQKMYPEQVDSLIPMFEKINQNFEDLQKNKSENDSDISEIKTTLKEMMNKVIDNMTAGTANITASNVSLASGASLSNVKLEDMSKLISCPECQEPIIVGRYASNVCPHCGAYIK